MLSFVHYRTIRAGGPVAVEEKRPQLNLDAEFLAEIGFFCAKPGFPSCIHSSGLIDLDAQISSAYRWGD